MSMLSRRSFMAGTAGAGALAIPFSAGPPQRAAAQGGKGPLFRIVGGMMEASNDRSSSNYETIGKFGVQTPLQIILGGTYCFTERYGSNSYSRLSLYLDQDNRKMVVGGKMLANNNNSSQPWVEQSSWGYTGAGTERIEGAFSGYGWSPVYQQGYLRCDLYMAQNPTGAYPVGGRYVASNDTGAATPVTGTFWGFSEGKENVLFGGYAWSDTYQKGSGQITVFTTG